MRAVFLLSVAMFSPSTSLWADGAMSRRERSEATDDARRLMAAGRHNDAAAAWEKALSPGASKKALQEGLPLLGRCYEEAVNFQKALTAYQRALQFDEKDVRRLLDLARVYTRVDLNREAVSLYERILALDKDRRDALLVLAQLYLKMGRHEDARREGARYVAWEPRDPVGQKLMADLDQAVGDFAAAALRREPLAAREPSPEVYFELGRLWVRAGNWERAEAAFSKAEDLGMRTGTLYLHRGATVWLRGDAAGAEAFWRKALERHPGMGAAHFFLAILEKEKGRSGPASREARRAEAGAQGDFLKMLAGVFPAETGGKK